MAQVHMYAGVRKALNSAPNYGLTGSALVKATGYSAEDVKTVLASLLEKGEIGFDKDSKEFYIAETAGQSQGQPEASDDDFAPAELAAVPPAPTPTPKAGKGQTTTSAPRKAPAPAASQGQGQTAAAPRKGKVSKGGKLPVTFTMSYKAINTLTAEECEKRVQVGQMVAAACVGRGTEDDLIAAEMLMRAVGKARKQYGKVTGQDDDQ